MGRHSTTHSTYITEFRIELFFARLFVLNYVTVVAAISNSVILGAKIRARVYLR